ncbi:UNVERIFIED_CONTAM: hypothetical protein FKN15_000052 [Acipenser sinensis]
MAKDLKPRLCCMSKGENGYGFHLHGEKGKSGQFIRKVEANSPAEAAGMHAGDRVVEVNGVNVEKETHHQVVQRIKALEKETRLLVVDKETDEFLHGLSLACMEEMARSGVSIPEPVPVPQASVKGNGAVWKQQLALSSGEPKRLSRGHSAENRKKGAYQLQPPSRSPACHSAANARTHTADGYSVTSINTLHLSKQGI